MSFSKLPNEIILNIFEQITRVGTNVLPIWYVNKRCFYLSKDIIYRFTYLRRRIVARKLLRRWRPRQKLVFHHPRHMFRWVILPQPTEL